MQIPWVLGVNSNSQFSTNHSIKRLFHQQVSSFQRTIRILGQNQLLAVSLALAVLDSLPHVLPVRK
jgi:hypothetical protein